MGILLGVVWVYFYVFLSKIVGEAKTVWSYQEDRTEHKCRGSRIMGVCAGSVGKIPAFARYGKIPESPEISEYFV